MANPWGANVSSAGIAQLASASDATCPAATSTIVSTGQVSTTTHPGSYVPVVDCALAILLGATPPTAIVVQLTINGGSVLSTYNVPTALLVANATIMACFRFFGPNSNTAFVPPGAPVNVAIRPSGQAVTYKTLGSSIVLTLQRGPDI